MRPLVGLAGEMCPNPLHLRASRPHLRALCGTILKPSTDTFPQKGPIACSRPLLRQQQLRTAPTSHTNKLAATFTVFGADGLQRPDSPILTSCSNNRNAKPCRAQILWVPRRVFIKSAGSLPEIFPRQDSIHELCRRGLGRKGCLG